MAILDDPKFFIDPITAPVRPVGVRWGLIAGVAGVIMTIIFNMTGILNVGQFSLGVTLLAALLGLAVSFYICYRAIKQHRDEELGGYITLGRCVTVGLWIGLVSGAIIGVYSLLDATIIHPHSMAEKMDMAREKLIESGQSEEAADQAMGFSKMWASPFIGLFSNLLGGVIGYAIYTLITGLFMKKDPPYPA